MIILSDSPWPAAPCAHVWEPCWKHHEEHDECTYCGALRYLDERRVPDEEEER